MISDKGPTVWPMESEQTKWPDEVTNKRGQASHSKEATIVEGWQLRMFG